MHRWLEMILRVLRGPSGGRAAGLLLEYTGQVADVDPARIQAWVEEHLGEEGREAIMTLWQRVAEQARADARADVLIRQLGIRFGAIEQGVLDQVRQSPEHLDRWTERVLTAPCLRNVFAD